MVWCQHNCNPLHLWIEGRGLVDSPTQGAPQRRVSERGGIPPPPRHTSRRPGAHAAGRHREPSGGDCRRGPRRRNYSRRLPFPEPGDSAPTFPPLSGSTGRQLSARELRDARPPVLKLVDRLCAAQLKMRAGRRCHPLKTVRAGNSNEPCCSFLPARGAVLIVPCGSRQ